MSSRFVHTSVLVLLTAAIGNAQAPDKENDLMLFGFVEDLKSGKPLQNICVRVFTDSVAGDSVFTDPLGKYQTFVPLHGLHRLVYTGEGHHRKVVQIDASGELDAAARGQEWNMRIDITLANSALALEEDLLDTPIGKAAYVPEMHEFQWDVPYTERYKQRFKQAVKEAERKN